MAELSAEKDKDGREPDLHEQALAKDPMTEIQQIAEAKIKKLGYVNTSDILAAFHDRTENGKLMTCIELREEFWAPDGTEPLRQYSRALTMQAELSMESSGDYTTVILQFERPCSDMNLIWQTLTKYGKRTDEVNMTSEEIPALVLVAVPMSLGGNYSCVAAEPIFWCLQPSSPYAEQTDQVRILFSADTVLFLADPTMMSTEVLDAVRKEVATEELYEAQKRLEDEQREEERKEYEVEMERYRQQNQERRRKFGSGYMQEGTEEEDSQEE